MSAIRQEVCRIPIPHELCAEIEALTYEVNGWKDLALAAQRIGASDDDYTRITRNFLRARTELALLTEEMRKTFVPEQYQSAAYRFELNYDTAELVILDVSKAIAYGGKSHA